MAKWQRRSYRISEIADCLNVSSENILRVTQSLELRLRYSANSDGINGCKVSANDAQQIEKYIRNRAYKIEKQLKRESVLSKVSPLSLIHI